MRQSNRSCRLKPEKVDPILLEAEAASPLSRLGRRTAVRLLPEPGHSVRKHGVAFSFIRQRFAAAEQARRRVARRVRRRASCMRGRPAPGLVQRRIEVGAAIDLDLERVDALLRSSHGDRAHGRPHRAALIAVRSPNAPVTMASAAAVSCGEALCPKRSPITTSLAGIGTFERRHRMKIDRGAPRRNFARVACKQGRKRCRARGDRCPRDPRLAHRQGRAARARFPRSGPGGAE